jgi:hypothetical protein
VPPVGFVELRMLLPLPNAVHSEAEKQETPYGETARGVSLQADAPPVGRRVTSRPPVRAAMHSDEDAQESPDM